MQTALGTDPVAIVLVPDSAPVVVLRVKIETLLELKLAAYTLVPSAEMQMPRGTLPVAIVLVPDSAPVVVLRVKIETVLDALLAV
jgi:hypothetical protein